VPRHLHCLFALAVALAAASAHADALLASSQTLIKAGEPLRLSVVPTGNENLGDELPARVLIGPRSVAVTLRADGRAASGRRDYLVTIPPELEGLGMLELTGQASSRLLVQFVPGSRAAPQIDTLARMQGKDRESEGVVDLSRRETALSSHEPMYFVVGSRGNTTARFQLSFKYRLLDPDGWASDLPWGSALTGLHFGYTQNSIWDLTANSKPFRDTTYKPSFFYQWGPYREIGSPHAFSLQAGYEHQSNGKEGAASRSIDTLFAKPAWRWEVDGNTHFAAALKLFGYLDKTDNPDIADYRGYSLLNLRYGNDDGWLLSTDLNPRHRGYAQLDLSYRLKRVLFSDAGGFLHFQYFNGYGESLLDYNLRRRPQFRVGVSIVR
jgi:outer membrane phospholipase A